ncbi:MAG: IclR family transcriptional regulator [Planctomycetota bacterium]
MESSILIKAFAILEYLVSTGERVSLAQLTERLEFNKPTIHRILKDLIGLGYVESLGGGVYGVTSKLQLLSHSKDDARLIEAADPIMTRLHEKTQETVNLGRLQQSKIRYLMVLESPKALRRVETTGDTFPFHSTALGRAIVSHLPETQWDRLIDDGELTPPTSKNLVDRKAFEQMLRLCKEQGYADEWEENDVGVMCVAMPVLVDDEPIAAISLTVPLARMDRKREHELVSDLKRSTAELAEKLA